VVLSSGDRQTESSDKYRMGCRSFLIAARTTLLVLPRAGIRAIRNRSEGLGSIFNVPLEVMLDVEY